MIAEPFFVWISVTLEGNQLEIETPHFLTSNITTVPTLPECLKLVTETAAFVISVRLKEARRIGIL